MLSLAWRNLWRNPRRTLITMSALTLGVIAIIAMRSYRDSTFTQITGTITRDLVGHIQVHARGYQDSPDVGSVVEDPAAVSAVIIAAVNGAGIEKRVLGAGLAGAGDASSGVLVSGIEPGARTLDIQRGRSLAAVAAREAVIGTELAEQLAVDVGGEIVVVGQAKDGSVANDRYRVVGVADAGTFELNSTAVYLHIEDAQAFFGLGAGVHQMVVRLKEDAGSVADVGAVDDDLDILRGVLDLKTLEALSWSEILPELTATIASKRRGQTGLDFIIFFIVALGVLNAMSMATFERTRELGVMIALGTRPRRIVLLIVTEALIQGVLSVVIGVAVIAIVFFFVGDLGLGSMGGTDFGGVRMPQSIPLTMGRDAVVAAAVTAVSTVLLGGLWPAWRASRLTPVEAMGSF